MFFQLQAGRGGRGWLNNNTGNDRSPPYHRFLVNQWPTRPNGAPHSRLTLDTLEPRYISPSTAEGIL